MKRQVTHPICLKQKHAAEPRGIFPVRRQSIPSQQRCHLNPCTNRQPVMSSAAEAELGALYIDAREAVPQRHLLNELGHPQPPTPIKIDNSTALGKVTNIIQPKRTKAMDMRFHWLSCHENQKQFARIGIPEPLT
eukprot:CCRYP_007866-RA/>CCRYP_007866-RA protein AED:0.45 eAED:0.45 QI:0/0/0/1/0/0/2/0/134